MPRDPFAIPGNPNGWGRPGFATSPNAKDGNWIPVHSTYLSRIRYLPKEALGRLRKGEVRHDKLFIQFRGPKHSRDGGPVFVYYDVPREVWNGLLAAGSKGKYFHYTIKGNYTFKPI
jgi:hypothetical protein